jgi:hypothetical protein
MVKEGVGPGTQMGNWLTSNKQIELFDPNNWLNGKSINDILSELENKSGLNKEEKKLLTSINRYMGFFTILKQAFDENQEYVKEVIKQMETGLLTAQQVQEHYN